MSDRAASDAIGDLPPGWPVVARIWRTVDVERTVAELGLVGEPLEGDELLGARGVLVRPTDGPPVAVLEPSTEGRLAYALARAGEGEAGVYVRPAGGLDAVGGAGWQLSREAGGPFGRSALLAGTHTVESGRFVVIVEAAPATIDA